MELITIKITVAAREALAELAKILAEEKGLSNVSLIDTASIAIQEALEEHRGKDLQK